MAGLIQAREAFWEKNRAMDRGDASYYGWKNGERKVV